MKRRPLVCQHLERVSRSALERYQPIIREYVRGRHGVYALYRKGRLYYVGLASNLRRRLKSHLKDKHGSSWDKFSIYLTIGDAHLKELESLLLRIAEPSGNSVSGKFARSEDLRRRFRRELMQGFRREADEMMGTVCEEVPVSKLRTKVIGKEPPLAAFISVRMKLRGRHGGRFVRARVRRDGRIRFKGKLFNSPSKAAVAACGSPTNGWGFWWYERAPGDWVRLRTLRQ